MNTRPTIIALMCAICVATLAVHFEQQADPKFAEARTRAIGNAKQLAVATLMYAADFDDKYPSAKSVASVKAAIRPYLRYEKIWATNNPAGSIFAYNYKLSGKSAVTIENPADMPLYYESKPWPDGFRVVAFSDGHCKAISPDTWSSIQRLVSVPRTSKTAKAGKKK